MHLPTLVTLLAASAGPALAGGPGQPNPNLKSAPDGPDKLELCGCAPIYKKMVECQPTKQGIRDCVCIENGNPGAWYGYIHNCRACLTSDNDDANEDFFDNLSSAMTQLLVSCTENGGGVVSDGTSICASNAMFEACASLREGKPSWASFERDGTVSNGTFSLNIDEPGQPAETSSGDGDSVSSTTTTSSPSSTSGSSSTGPITSATSGSSPSGTGASGPATTTTSVPASAMGLVASGPRVLMGAAVACGVGALLL
ncbi:hypothetical protein B0H66DRAFT_552412 [Apodospora peruviana]|uniref:Uncharacterized protein n=1 Tax=Apodospora peruviana TaxID=516989 RepID=A0AAE0IAT7_9PEZI|nr:hypothetical protein B0H66DRAFT_552412 [Apodospora peruviana]